MTTRILPAAAAVAALGTGLAACGESPASTLSPGGPQAARIAELGWVLTALGAAVYVAVLAYLLVAIKGWGQARGADPRAGQGPGRDAPGTGPVPPPPEDPPERAAAIERSIVVGGFVAPAVVLGGVYLLTLRSMNQILRPPSEPALTIEVTGNQWWWAVRYPGTEAVTANEIHVPVGVPVRLDLGSADVIHSLWVPGLGGKLDAVPGRTNALWLQADAPGTWYGQCAEFCGLQHAKMALRVVAEPQADFDAWLAREAEPAAEPSTDEARRGRDVFLTSPCIGCHTVRGTSAAGDLGPDLTHIGARRTLGAGQLPNDRAHMAGWIANAHAYKPGVEMPPITLGSGEMEPLLSYLESLR